MQLAILYVSTAIVFLVVDAIMLTLVMKPLFQQHIGPLMLDGFRAGPAAAFYAAYVAGLIYLVSWDGLKEGAPVLIPAAIIGAMAYGTYEFTSYAIMKDWHVTMLLADTTWGAVLTGLAALGGVLVTQTLVKT